ncbi:MAG TPA: hypothetical protein VN745_04575 [Verrucomicrobiae bacterium]|nr:hypothetical protein [Verrucomicrobiae bacterium]
MGKFLGFLAAAGAYGVASVVIAFILFFISVYEHAHNQNVAAYVLILVGASIFCIGAFIAWSAENNKYEVEKAKHDAPNFDLIIESILTLYNPTQNMTVIVFAAMLTNRGAPSHAIGWRVRYQSNSIDITVKYVSLPQEKVNFGAIGGRTLVLKRQDLLPARCLPMIERGETKHGRVVFEIQGDRRQEIYSGNAVMRVMFDDNAHRLCEGLFKATGEVNDLQAYPDEEVF